MSVLIGLLSTSMSAQDSPTIINRSPFVPTNFNPGLAGTATTSDQAAAAGYEFRGVYQIGDRYWFLVSEPKSRDGSWIELGGYIENLEARRYDPESKALTVFSNNSELTLQLATVEANPKPIPVQGLVKTTTRTPTKTSTPTPVRRTIRPTTGTSTTVKPNTSQKNPTPAPAWLEKLRAEAAERRAQAGATGTGENNQAQPQRRTITPRRPDQQGKGSSGSQNQPGPNSGRSR